MSIEDGSATAFISDTAANFATYQSAITTLIADGDVASVFTDEAALADGSTSINLTIVGGGNSVGFTSASGEWLGRPCLRTRIGAIRLREPSIRFGNGNLCGCSDLNPAAPFYCTSTSAKRRST